MSLLLFAGDDRSQATTRTLRTLEVMRNVTLLDRPIRVTAVISTVRAALRGRRRQYELRDVLAALESSRQDAERARDDAERANRLKDEFLATLSHELRTPLNAILGWVSLLRDQRVEAARIPKVLEIVARNAQSQAQLISDVLDVSRVITGRLRLRLQPVVISRILRDAMDTVRPAADAKEITLDLTVSGEPPRMNGDAERLRQVFWNLLSNAVKFTPAGGRVQARIDRVDSQIRVTISDSGVGIPREFLPYAFERFRQADQSFTRPHGGLGLGLAIVKHLVETHGGEVSVASDGPGTGTTFTVQLPIGGAQALAVAEPESDVATNEDGGPEIGNALFGRTRADRRRRRHHARPAGDAAHRPRRTRRHRRFRGGGHRVARDRGAVDHRRRRRHARPGRPVDDARHPPPAAAQGRRRAERRPVGVRARRGSPRRARGRLRRVPHQAGAAGRRARRDGASARRAAAARPQGQRRARVVVASAAGRYSGSVTPRRPRSFHRSPTASSRCAIVRSVNVRGPTARRSISSQVHGADTGAPGRARTV